jgi:hypothetical protein
MEATPAALQKNRDEMQALVKSAAHLRGFALSNSPRVELAATVRRPGSRTWMLTATRRWRLPASSAPQLERAWDAWQAERYQRGEIGQRPGYTDNPFRPR